MLRRVTVILLVSVLVIILTVPQVLMLRAMSPAKTEPVPDIRFKNYL